VIMNRAPVVACSPNKKLSGCGDPLAHVDLIVAHEIAVLTCFTRS
jgi:hypothetical protein